MERTVLAWRRTGTAFVVAVAVVGRLLLSYLGGWFFLVAVASATTVVVVALAARRRLLTRAAGPAGGPARAPGPWLAAVALATAAGGLGVALAVLHRSAGG
ncbi:hypothetical protein [Micromonospora matsumotoense]|uniref:hypothetical protein n=1 Tax=Micromonospora matsumotoense TaxID=121616 RepID=UPI00114CBDAC|nr:hypothetical protein [Micromonospora matsumotoense]